MAIVKDLSGNSPVPADNSFKDLHLSRKDRVKRTVPVTTSDTDDIADGITESLLVSTAGSYKVTYGNGDTDTVYLAAGVFHPINVRRIWTTGSDATTGIVAGY